MDRMPGPRPSPLPPEMANGAFLVARAMELGVSERRLRSKDLDRPYRGVRSPRADPHPDTATEAQLAFLRLCRAQSLRLRPGECFSHHTAARLWGCPLPNRWDPAEPLHAIVDGQRRASKSRGIVGHSVRTVAVSSRYGLPVTSPEETWLALASSLSIEELVAVGDHLVMRPRFLDARDIRPYTTVVFLTESVRQFSGRGSTAAALALPLLRQGAESRPETLLRLLLARAGFPPVTLQERIEDAAGHFIGYADLFFPTERVAVEYDGDHHRTDSRQYNVDEIRKERMRAALKGYVSVRSWELFGDPSGVVRRVGAAIESARTRSNGP